MLIKYHEGNGSFTVSGIRNRPQIVFPVVSVNILRLPDNICQDIFYGPPTSTPEEALTAENILLSHTTEGFGPEPESRTASDGAPSLASSLPKFHKTKHKFKKPKVSAAKDVPEKVKLKAINKTSLKKVKYTPNVNHSFGSTWVPENDPTLFPQNASGLVSENAFGLDSESASGLVVSGNASGLIVSENVSGLAVPENVSGLAVPENVSGLVVSENTPRLVSENTSRLVSENASQLISENTSRLVSENASRLVSENTSPLVSENTSRLVSENTSRLASENTSRLVSENTSRLASENTSRLASENTSRKVSETSSGLVSKNIFMPVPQNGPKQIKAKPKVPRNDNSNMLKRKRPQKDRPASVNSQVFKVSQKKNKATPAIYVASSAPSTPVISVNTVSTLSAIEANATSTPTLNLKGYVIPRKPKPPKIQSPEPEPSPPENAPHIPPHSQSDVKGMRSPSPPVISFEEEGSYSPLRFMTDAGSNAADLEALLAVPNDTDRIPDSSSVKESPHSSPQSRSPSPEEADAPNCEESQTRSEALPPLPDDADVLDICGYDLGEFDF